MRAVDWFPGAATLVFVVALWVLALWFGHDSRDGRDW